MTVSETPRAKWTSLLIGVPVALVVLGGIAIGGNYLWQEQFGPTAASTADCELAQELFDKAKNPPTDPAEAEQWVAEIRAVRYRELVDQGLSTELGRYVSYQAIRATGGGERPSAEQIEGVRDRAKKHCRKTDVDLDIAPLSF